VDIHTFAIPIGIYLGGKIIEAIFAKLWTKVDPKDLAAEVTKMITDRDQMKAQISEIKISLTQVFTKDEVNEKFGRQQDKIDNLVEDVSELKQDVKDLRTLVVSQHQEIMNAVRSK